MTTYYSDPEKQKKLETAIQLGFIAKSTDQDGIERYTLTSRGQAKWQQEIAMKFAQGFRGFR